MPQGFAVPILGRRVLVGVRVEHPVDEAVDEAEEVLALVLAVKDLAPLAVDRLPLLVHDVVVFEEVLADGEVLALDLLLGPLDGPGDHVVLDGHAVAHADPGHEARRCARCRRCA